MTWEDLAKAADALWLVELNEIQRQVGRQVVWVRVTAPHADGVPHHHAFLQGTAGLDLQRWEQRLRRHLGRAELWPYGPARGAALYLAKHLQGDRAYLEASNDLESFKLKQGIKEPTPAQVSNRDRTTKARRSEQKRKTKKSGEDLECGQEPLVGTRTVAEYTSYTPAYISWLAKNQLIPCYVSPTPGTRRKRYRFRLSEIDRWLEGFHQKVKPKYEVIDRAPGAP